jgi:preprotein translocase subunit SecD
MFAERRLVQRAKRRLAGSIARRGTTNDCEQIRLSDDKIPATLLFQALAGQQMRFKRLIAMMTAAATGLGTGLANAEDIALSLVHPKGRIDIPVSAVGRVHASAKFAVRNTETGEVHEYPDPYVEVCYAKDIQESICQLTQKIIGEPMAIVVDCDTISRPIVREPLCARPCFQISAKDIAEATALAKRIRNGTNRACAPSS